MNYTHKKTTIKSRQNNRKQAIKIAFSSNFKLYLSPSYIKKKSSIYRFHSISAKTTKISTDEISFLRHAHSPPPPHTHTLQPPPTFSFLNPTKMESKFQKLRKGENSSDSPLPHPPLPALTHTSTQTTSALQLCVQMAKPADAITA